jgi:hypothetical protein
LGIEHLPVLPDAMSFSNLEFAGILLGDKLFPISQPGQAGTKQDVVGAAPCGRPQNGQPRGVAPTVCCHLAHDLIFKELTNLSINMEHIVKGFPARFP